AGRVEVGVVGDLDRLLQNRVGLPDQHTLTYLGVVSQRRHVLPNQATDGLPCRRPRGSSEPHEKTEIMTGLQGASAESCRVEQPVTAQGSQIENMLADAYADGP